MYKNILKFIDEAIGEKNTTLDAYRSINQSLKKEVETLKAANETLKVENELLNKTIAALEAAQNGRVSE